MEKWRGFSSSTSKLKIMDKAPTGKNYDPVSGDTYDISSGKVLQDDAPNAEFSKQISAIGGNPATFDKVGQTPTNGAQAGQQAFNQTATPQGAVPQTDKPAGYKPDLSYEEAVANVSSVPSAMRAQVTANLQKAYGKAHQQLQQGGAPAQDGNRGAINAAVGQNMGESQVTSPQVDNFYGTNPYIQQTNQQLMDWLNPEATSGELQKYVDAYATDRAELAGLKTELMNNKRIMAGTESDIRDEITKSNGFATESQIQAMTLGRNRFLIAQSAKLTDLITSQQDAVNGDAQMMQFAKDQANSQFNQRMSILSYQQENNKFMYNAAQQQFQNNLDLMGADGLYASMQDNPQMISYYEKLSGMPPGGLAIASEQATEQKLVDKQKDQLQLDVLRSNLETDRAQRSNIYSQIDERSNASNVTGTIDGKPQNVSQSSANGYADRLNESNIVIGNLDSKFASPLALGGKTILGFGLPNALKSGDRQSFETAKTNFITAVLRRESGASIAPAEFVNEDKKYFPQPGDKPETVKLKSNARNTAINNLYREANVNRPVLPGMIIESKGVKYKVDSDGVNLTKI